MYVSPEDSGYVEINGRRYSGNPVYKSFVDESVATVQATAFSGMVFDQWTGMFSSTSNPAEVTVDCDMIVTAEFVLKEDTNSQNGEEPFSGYEVYIPHITGGSSDWIDYLQVNNLSMQEAGFTITLYSMSGEVLYSKNHSAGAMNQEVINLKMLDEDSWSGKVSYSEPELYFRVTQENLNGGGVAEFKLSGDLEAAVGFFFSDAVSSILWKGLALTNFGEAEAQVQLSISGGGSQNGSVSVAIGPKQKLSGLYETWFPEVSFSNAQVVTAASQSSSLSGIAISGNSDNSLLLFTPGSRLEE